MPPLVRPYETSSTTVRWCVRAASQAEGGGRRRRPEGHVLAEGEGGARGRSLGDLPRQRGVATNLTSAGCPSRGRRQAFIRL
jgi:hypothetical protein